MPVSIAAGAGAIAGAEVSAVAASSFFEVQAARTRTAATRARRFIYDLLERQTWNKSPVRARGRGARFWRGRNFISSGSSVKGDAAYLPSRARTRLTTWLRISLGESVVGLSRNIWRVKTICVRITRAQTAIHKR